MCFMGLQRVGTTDDQTELRLMSQTVKHLSTIQETQVQSLGWEDPLEKGRATHSSIFAVKIPRMEEAGGLRQRFGHN